MISEPNFVLGIKQKSLASKEDPYVHITIRSHTCLFAGSRLHGILQPSWLCAVSKSNNQAICASPYQICAYQDFVCWNQPHRRAPRPLVRKTQKSGQPKSTQVPPHAAVSFGKSPTRRLRFLTSRLSFRYTCRPDSLLVHRSTEPETPALIWPYTRPHAPLGFLASPSRAGGLSMRLPRAEICYWCHLTSLDDVITLRQQPRKHVHISLSPRQRHVIGWR